MLLGILEQALAFTFMDFPWVATAGTASELVFGALENPSNGADGDLKILCKLPLGYRLALIAFMDALSRLEGEMHTLPKERLRNQGKSIQF